MIRRGFMILALSAIPATGYAQTATIEGTVRSGDSGMGLGNARVEIAALGLVEYTGATGAFSITGVPSGTHSLEVRLLGFGLQTQEVTVASGQTVNVDILLGIVAFELNELVVVGSRTPPRTVTESMVPVDVIPVSDIARQSETNIDFLLRTVVPSYNVNMQPISDAATITRPANLRGLASDHTLVLLNGKRRHRGAVITWLGGGLSDGAQGPDIGSVPGIALRQVEVLRDGASAQYGSDAIAGVLNFILSDDRSGGRVEVKQGSFYEGDGDALSVAGNFGVPLGESGFANVTVEYGNQDPTDRAVQRGDAAGLIAAGNTAVRTPTAQIWGSPRVTDDLKVWVNTGYTFDDDEQAYAFGNLGTKEVDGGFFFRNPNTRGGVFSGDGGQTLLIGDVLDAMDGVNDGSAGCPVVNIVNNVPDAAALAQVFDDPNCFSFQEMFPGGFTPQFGGNVLDASVVAGIKGRTDAGVFWDASTSYGKNLVDFFIYNTVNAALGPETPPTSTPGSTTRKKSTSTWICPTRSTTARTSRVDSSSVRSASRSDRARTSPGRSGLMRPRASVPPRTDSRASARSRPATGAAATPPSTRISIWAMPPRTDGASAWPAGTRTSRTSAARPRARCPPGWKPASRSHSGPVQTRATALRRPDSRTPSTCRPCSTRRSATWSTGERSLRPRPSRRCAKAGSSSPKPRSAWRAGSSTRPANCG